MEANLCKIIKISVYLYAVICLISLASVCQATEYTLGSIRLGKPLENDLGTHYVCNSRAEFSNTVECDLKDVTSTNSSASPVTDTLIKSSDGRVLYAYDKSHKVGSLDKVANNIASEISNALRGMKPRRFSVDGATVAIWGDVNLEEISSGTEEYYELEGLVEQKYGLLVATTGDLDTTKDNSQPVYRVIGGDGLVVIISQDGPRQVVVQRLIVAAGTLAERNFDSQARQFLERDQASPADDFSNWPEVAFMIRRLALNTTPENANRIVDETFSAAASKKYYSHVWAFLPTSVIKHLKDGTYMAADVFGEKTEFPEIRARIIAQLNAAPAEPFSEFLLYTLGRFSDAVKFNSRSPIHTVLAYASGHSTLRKVMSNVFERIAKPGDRETLSEQIHYYSYRDKSYKEDPYQEETIEEQIIKLANKDFFNDHAYEHIPWSNDDYKDDKPSLTQYLNYFNQFPERYNSSPLVLKIANFASLTDSLLPQFEEVLKDRGSPHFDDALYFLGWLAYHRGNVADALNKFQLAIALIPRDGSYVEQLDYPDLALHHTSRIFRTLSPEDAIKRVQNSEVLSSDSVIWETVLVSLYNSHQYRLVMTGARQALGKFGITIEDLPVTTDPERTTATLTKLKLADYASLEEIVYLYHSSREIEQVEELLSDLNKQPASSIETKIKYVIIKYSLTSDSDLEDNPSRRDPKPLHKDLRQSIFVAQRSLDLLPKTAAYSKLRQWLHYKRIRLLAQFDPIKVAAANGEFRDEFPKSALLDDGMAEQIFAEAVTVGDMVKAAATFDSLRQRYPSSNAVDNAYSWLAIGMTCAGQPANARKIDQQIVRLFPLTRHARYARERIQNPTACDRLLQLYMWDYQAMRWRERNRIDTLQDAIKASGVTSTP